MPEEAYRNRVRIRVNGILLKSSSILLVRVKSPVTDRFVWMPPGGGLEFGETLHQCLSREFLEETGLHIEAENFLFVNELVEKPYHAVELYYKVKETGGSLKLGRDPEHDSDSQIIDDIQWMPLLSLSNISFSPEKLITYLEEHKF